MEFSALNLEPAQPETEPVSLTIRISDLQVMLDKSYGKGAWLDWEPETIMIDLHSKEVLILEKIYVLQGLNKALNSIISLPEFLLWTTSICNNETAEFETINMPTCLELAWALEEVKKVGFLTGQPFQPTEELIDVVSYLLRLEGFSEPVTTFSFVPASKLEAGQTPEDSKMKEQAIRAYIYYMQKPGAEA